MGHMNFDTYQMICELLDNENLDICEIAKIANVTVDEVRYVDRAENGDC